MPETPQSIGSLYGGAKKEKKKGWLETAGDAVRKGFDIITRNTPEERAYNLVVERMSGKRGNPPDPNAEGYSLTLTHEWVRGLAADAQKARVGKGAYLKALAQYTKERQNYGSLIMDDPKQRAVRENELKMLKAELDNILAYESAMKDRLITEESGRFRPTPEMQTFYFEGDEQGDVD